jgi:hypothetical protein
MLAEWEDIAPAAELGACNVRLADSEHPLDFRIGRDFRGRFVFQLDAACLPDLSAAVPRLSGIDCEIEEIPPDRCRLSLNLHHQRDLPNFRLMCTGLMLATEDFQPENSRIGMLRSIEELHRWQEMLRHQQERLLSRSEIIGLVGELLFVRDVLSPRLGILPSLRAWNGPEGHEQDFVLGGTIFEVKTQVVTSDRRIRISSEDQLDPVQGRIIIGNQGLAPIPQGDDAGRSLNTLVDEIRDLAVRAGGRATDCLDIALLRAGYEPRDEYGEELWVLVDRAFYDVVDDFPRIERRDLRLGVEMVKYSIRVADCQKYAVDVEATITEVLG